MSKPRTGKPPDGERLGQRQADIAQADDAHAGGAHLDGRGQGGVRSFLTCGPHTGFHGLVLPGERVYLSLKRINEEILWTTFTL